MSGLGDVKNEILAAMANHSGLVKQLDSCLAILKKHSLVYQAQIHSSHIGVHESNRDGMGVSVDHIFDLAESVFTVGFSDKVGRRICIELPMGDTSADATRDFNKALVESSNGRF